MPHKKYLLFLSLVFAGLIFNARVANACSCGPRPTVLDAYEESDIVVIARAVSVEKVDANPEQVYVHEGVKSVKMVVEKVFKGNLKVGNEMTFGQGGGADCIWTFDEKVIGESLLFYLNTSFKRQNMWLTGYCGRLSGAEDATEDLLFLNNINKLRGRTRISGRVNFESAGLSAKGRKIRIAGANKTYEVKADEDGVFEIYDLPAGKYLIEPEMPFGWKVDKYWLRYSSSYAEGDEGESAKKIPIRLEDKRHASLEIRFEIDNAIRGRVFDPSGKPMKDVCVKAVQPQTGKPVGFNLGCTDEDGNFAITELARGSYILVVNEDGKLSSREPFEMFYYPNVPTPENAAVITIGPGDVRDNIQINVPKLEEIVTVEGVFLYSDGKAVADKWVEFEAEKQEEKVDATASAKTDSDGRFSIKILKGLKGKLRANMYASSGEFENCPKIEALIKRNGGKYTKIEVAVEISTEEKLYEVVELKFPFPACKKIR